MVHTDVGCNLGQEMISHDHDLILGQVDAAVTLRMTGRPDDSQFTFPDVEGFAITNEMIRFGRHIAGTVKAAWGRQLLRRVQRNAVLLKKGKGFGVAFGRLEPFHSGQFQFIQVDFSAGQLLVSLRGAEVVGVMVG